MNFQYFAQKLEMLVNQYNAFAAQPIRLTISENSGSREIKVYRSELHFLDVVGTKKGINTTQLAATLGISKSAVTQNMNRLIKKGLVVRKISDIRENEIEIFLSDGGNYVYKEHQNYHREMLGEIEKCFQNLTPQEMAHLESLLTAFEQYFSGKEKKSYVSSIIKNT